MNLDALSYSEDIQQSARKVKLSEKGGRWMLLGYVDKGKRKGPHLMTIDVQKEGNIWCDLLDSFEDDKIQYGYAKLDLEAKRNTKLFLIQWVGEKVDEDEKLQCIPHLNEIRNLIPNYDKLVTSTDALDIQSQVHNFLSRSQTVSSDSIPSKSSYENTGSFSSSKEQKKSTQKKPLEKRGSSRLNTLQFGMRNTMKSDSFTLYLQPVKTIPKMKVAIIGKSAVGKTYIYLNYNGGGKLLSDPQGVAPTIGADFLNKDVIFEEHEVTLEIWDTAGQERFVTFMSVWTRNAKVVLCVYDITDAESFNDLPKLIQAARDYADPRAVFFLVGNKADLVHRREVQETQAENFALQNGMTFMECSGLTGLNILKLFESITEQVVSVYQDTFPSYNNTLARLREEQTIQLNNYNTLDKNRHGNCQRCK